MDLGGWMNGKLIGWGVNAEVANFFDEALIAVLMVGVAVVLDGLCQAILVGGMKRYTQHSPHVWNTLLMKRRVFHHLIHTLPAGLVFWLLPLAFVHGKELLFVSQKACVLYVIYSLLMALNGALLMVLDVYGSRAAVKNRPVKGLVQVMQVLVFLVGVLVMIAVGMNRSPASLLAGLGASAAILMLVFKDTLLDLVAGIQLSANDMVRPGDWITIPSTSADGIVLEITLNTVKIQNFDHTFSTVPPSLLVNTCFQNWRGMAESDGRRVMKNILLDVNTLKFCTPEMLDACRRNLPLLADYLPEPGEAPTNAQVYRYYIERYLGSLAMVNVNLDLIVTQLQPTPYGLPIQVYFFLRNKEWKDYERIQSDIFDHLLTVVSRFELKLYQTMV
ncbi:MAG: mechanosensitive ion channel [Bacteroides sp.]